MNTIVREVNPTKEIELTDTQLSAVYGACDDQWQSQAVCQAQLVCQPQLVRRARPICEEQEEHSSTIIHKKVIVVFEEDFSLEKDSSSARYLA